MILKRIFACSILTLLLSASSLGAACDVSCAFASMSSDCHSEQDSNQATASGGMNMAGMAMVGMTMPEMGGGQDQQSNFSISGTMARHISIGEMGPCEKQACDSSSAVSANTYRSAHANFHSIPAAIEPPHATTAPPHFQDTRGDTASYLSGNRNSFQLNLRV
jgi:hypothetical protein